MNRCKPTTKRNRLIAAMAVCLVATPCVAEYTVRIPTSTLGATGSTGSQTGGGGGGGGAAPGDGSVWESWAGGNDYTLSPDYSELSSTFSSVTEFPNENYPASEITTINIHDGSITSLQQLQSLQSLSGKLKLNISGLGSLTGLENVGSIGGNFQVSETGITSFSEMTSLTNIGGDLIASNTANLSDLSGLEGVTSLGGLNISGAPITSLTALSGANIGSANNSIQLSDVPNLTTLNGLEGLTEAKYIFIEDTHSISDLSALSNVTSLGKYPYASADWENKSFKLDPSSSLDSITNADFFSSLTFTQGIIDLSQLINITDVTGLSNLQFDSNDSSSSIKFPLNIPVTNKMTASSTFCQQARSLGNRVYVGSDNSSAAIDAVCEAP